MDQVIKDQLFFPATLRNRYPIREVFSEILPKEGTILEVGSGSGEHAVFFQKSFPNILWQSSDINYSHLKSISAWIRAVGLENQMVKPINIDISKKNWEIDREIKVNLKAIVAINVLHISSYHCTTILIEESSRLLKNGGSLIMYGPFKRDGLHTSISNQIFDKQLKSEKKEWGVRDISDIKVIAEKNGFSEYKIFNMPANNHILTYKKA